MTFITLLDLLGTFAFAVSGIRSAANRNFDWFGAYVVGLVAAIGGGTTRDLLLGLTPFWMRQPSYLVTTAAALCAILLMGRRIFKMGRTLLIFDAIGLGLFMVVGINKTLEAHFPFWVAVVMGTITGCVGGVLRDVLVNDMPVIFREDLYAMTCVLGGLVYYACMQLHCIPALTYSCAALTVILARVAAMLYHLRLPTLKPFDD